MAGVAASLTGAAAGAGEVARIACPTAPRNMPAESATKTIVRGNAMRLLPSSFGGSGVPSNASILFARQPIAHALLCQQISRPRRIGFDLASEVGHEHTQVVRLLHLVGPPHFLEQLPV